MKTNVTCSLDTELVARLDAFRAPLGIGRSGALEVLLGGLPPPGGWPLDQPVAVEEQVVLEEPVIENPPGDPSDAFIDVGLRADGSIVSIEPEVAIDEPAVSLRHPKKSTKKV